MFLVQANHTPIKSQFLQHSLLHARGHFLLFVDFLAMNPEFKLNISASDHITRETELTTDVLFRSIADSSTFIRRWYIEYHHGLYASQSYLEKFGIPQSVSDLNRHTSVKLWPLAIHKL
ncbi:MAG: hypothetical protein H6925_05400 [Holosporaceae bacterium]|nr:MAG: hypothetical protein H6925_05400 [Holosporaceae bacterium]